MRNGMIVCGLTVCLVHASVCAFTERFQAGSEYAGAEDTYLRQAYPDASPGAYEEVHVGYEAYGPGGACRGLVRFDIADLDDHDGWTDSTEIVAARVNLYLKKVSGGDFTQTFVGLYRIAEPNSGWNAGDNSRRIESQQYAACWNFRTYDDTYLHPDQGGTSRHQPWAGDTAGWDAAEASWNDKNTGNGCGAEGTDYHSFPVSSLQLGPDKEGGWVSFDIEDPSFLSTWLSAKEDNAGLLLAAPELEDEGTAAAYSTLQFASSENENSSIRPVLEIELKNYHPADNDGIAYSLPRSGNVSIVICDSSDVLVRELLHAAPRGGGGNVESWDCTDRPLPGNDYVAQTVPDGEYTAKILLNQGIRAEYMMTIGTTPPWEPWPGDHVANGCIEVDETGVYVGARTSESTVKLIKMTHEGKRIWQAGNIRNNGWQCGNAMDSDGEFLYISNNKEIIVVEKEFPVRDIEKMPRVNTFTHEFSNDWNQGDLWGLCDVAVGETHVVVSGPQDGKVLWMDKSDGTILSTVDVADVRAVAAAPNGNTLVLTGTTLRSYPAPGGSFTTLIDEHLENASCIETNPANGDIYIGECSPSHQVKRFSSTGELLRTYGKYGGRSETGRYVPQDGFFDLVDITVQSDGSFWIQESSFVMPRRTSHWSVGGEVLREFYGGHVYSVPGLPDPADPRNVWLEHGRMFSWVKVDYENRTWKVHANYRHDRLGSSAGDAPHYNVIRRGEDIYLAHGAGIRIQKLEREADTLRPVAGGYCYGPRCNDSVWNVVMAGIPEEEIGGRNGWVFTWADLNGNGSWRVPGGGTDCREIFPQHEKNIGAVAGGAIPGYNNYLDDNLTIFGTANPLYHPGPTVRVVKPRWIVGDDGEEVPLYTADSISHPFERDPYGITLVSGDGITRDSKGNTYCPLRYEHCDMTDSIIKARGMCGRYAVLRWDSTGTFKWMVGLQTGGVPAPGEVRHLTRPIGAAKNCVLMSDRGPWQYAWHESGCFVDHLVGMNSKHPDSRNLSDKAFDIIGEHTAGDMYEVKPGENIPGLNAGDLLYFGSTHNSVSIYRLHGFEDIYGPITTTITVKDGKIVAQSDVGVLRTGNSIGTGADLAVHSGRGGMVGIDYTLPARMHVRLELYDAFGRRIKTIVNNRMSEGRHSALVHGSSGNDLLSSGMYVVRLSAGKYDLARRVMVVR